MKRCIITLSALAIATSLSFAQDKPTTPPKAPAGGHEKGTRLTPEEIFKKLDTNGDGSLSLEEYKAGPMGKRNPAKAEEMYKKMDTNSDGKVSLEEYKAHLRMMRESKGGKEHKEAAPPAPAPAPMAPQ